MFFDYFRPNDNCNPVLSLFVTYHPVCNKSNTTGATSGTETCYRSGVPVFTSQFLVGFVLLDFFFTVWCFVYYCLSFCPFSFDHCIVVSDLRLLISKNTWISIPWFTASYYHFCILKVSTNIVNTILSVTCNDISEILLKVAFNTLAFPFPTLFNVNENKLIHEMKTNQTNRFTIHLFHFPRKQTF